MAPETTAARRPEGGDGGPVLSQRAVLFAAWVGTLTWALAPVLSRARPGWQFLAWIPDTAWLAVIALPAFTALGLSPWLRRRRLAWGLLSFMAMVPPAVGALARDVGWADRPSGPTIRIAYLNAQTPLATTASGLMDRLLSLDPDLIVVLNPGRIPRELRARVDERDGPEEGWSIQWRNPVMAASKWGSSRLRTIPIDETISVVELGLPRELASMVGVDRMLVIDLPSDPSLDRDEVADRLDRGLSEAGIDGLDAYGLVLGDFNMPPRTPALGELRGTMVDLIAENGSGWLATWPRQRPFLRIDHVLGTVDGPIAASTFDPGNGGHLGYLLEFGVRSDSVPEAQFGPDAQDPRPAGE